MNDPDLIRIGLQWGLSPERIAASTGTAISRIMDLEARGHLETAEVLMAYGLAESSNGTGNGVAYGCSVPCAPRATRPPKTKTVAPAVASVQVPSLEAIRKFEAELLGMDIGIAGRPPPWSKESGDNAIRDRFAAWRTAAPETLDVIRRFEAGQRQGEDLRILRWHMGGFRVPEISNLLGISESAVWRIVRECCGKSSHNHEPVATASRPNIEALKQFERKLLSWR
jgi:DNA-binding Lrp family transcriptional regulator